MVRTQRPVEALQIFTDSELKDMNLQGEPERMNQCYGRGVPNEQQQNDNSNSQAVVNLNGS